MGMFDTIKLDMEHACPACGKCITSLQVKAFENLLEVYQVKDCVSHAEEMRIIKEELFCDSCSKHTETHIYLAVNRGILLGTAGSLREAQALLNDLNLEKLILWYHDLYRRYTDEKAERRDYKRFLLDLKEWYGERLHEKPLDDSLRFLRFLWNRKHLQGALGPVESIRRFLTYKKMIRVLDDLWEEGREVLPIYYPEQIDPGEELWSADVYQDDLNERGCLNWTWTVMSKKLLEMEEEQEDDLSEWTIVVDEPFSEDVISKAVERWLKGRRYEFEVKMIPLEEARGSGLVKKLREMDIESETKDAVPMEEGMKQMKEEENRRMAEMIDQKKSRKKVFTYLGFYGSLVPDVESGRLIGKIEGIRENVIYEGNTVRECEDRFREAVMRHMEGEVGQQPSL